MNQVRNILLLILASMTGGPVALSDPFNFSYSGRLVDQSGSPLAGPITLEIKFFNASSGGKQLGPAKTLPDVKLANGAFQIDVGLSPEDRADVFTGSTDTWVQVTEVDSGKTYPRQKITVSPYALKIPIDDSSLGWDSNGKLQIRSNASVSKIDGADVSAGGATNGQVLSWNNSTKTWEPTDVGPSSITPDSIGATQLAPNAVGLSEIDNSLCVDTQILKKSGGAWVCAVDAGGAGSDLQNGGNALGIPIVAGTNDAQNLQLETNDQPRLTIDTSGNVGIGTTGPLSKLEVAANGFTEIAARSSGVGTSFVGKRSNGTLAAPTASTTNQNLALVQAYGYGDTAFNEAARISMTSEVGATFSDTSSPGRITFATSPTGTTTPVSRLTIDSTGNIGMGTATPSTQLHVYHTTDHANITAETTDGTKNAHLMLKNPTGRSGDVQFWNNGAQRFRVAHRASSDDLVFSEFSGSWQDRLTIKDTTGRVGIGTDNPAGLLDVDGDLCLSGDCISSWSEGIEAGNVSFDGDVNHNVNIVRNPTADTPGTHLTIGAGGATVGATDKDGGTLNLSSGMATGTGGSRINFQVSKPGGSGTTDNGLATAMTLSSSGYLGIGTTSPSAPLHIEGGGEASSAIILNNTGPPANNMKIEFESGGSEVAQIHASTADGVAGELNFQTSNVADTPVTRMMINSTGNVGIGTGGPLANLHVKGPAASAAEVFKITRADDSDVFGVTSGGTVLVHSNPADSDRHTLAMRPTYPLSTDRYFIGFHHRVSSGWSGLDFSAFHENNFGTGNPTDRIDFYRRYNWNGTTWDKTNIMSLRPEGVGIGDSAPNAHLEVSADGTTGGMAVAVSSNDAADGDLFTILENGHTGIGINAPNTPLHINAPSTQAIPLTVQRAGNQNAAVQYKNDEGSMYAGLSSAENWAVGPTSDLGTAGTLTVTSGGAVGIGTPSPNATSLLHLYGDIPRLSIQDNDDPNSLLQLKTYSSNSGVLSMHSNTGVSQLSLQPVPEDGTSNAEIRMFRETNTTGTKTLQMFKGDNTTAVHNQFGVDGAASFFNGGGNVGIGTTTPDFKLEIAPTTGDGLQIHRQADLAGSSLGSRIDFSFNDGNSAGAEESKAQIMGVGYQTGATDAGELRFLTADPSGALQQGMVLDGDGNVGIGTTTPDAKLYVEKGPVASLSTLPTGTWAGKVINGIDAIGENGLIVANRWLAPTSTAFEVGGLFDGGNGFDSYFKVDGNGKVGIGSSSPNEALDVGTGNVAMGWELISNQCNNPATVCTATCTGTKRALGGSCEINGTWTITHSVGTANTYLCSAQSSPSNYMTARVYCANIR